jgi:hypothetical protein
MFLGDRRTTHSIRAFRSPAHVVVIPNGAILRDVRGSIEPGYRFPAAMRIMAGTKISLHLFEYKGETLYVHEVHSLLEATTEVELDLLQER